MNYDTLNTYLQNLIQDQAPSADYTQILPAVIQDAEQRIYRDMDFLATRTVNSGLMFTIGSRSLMLPTTSTDIIVIQGCAQISPGGNTPSQGTRNALEPTTLDFIDFVWPTESVTGPGEYFTLLNNATLIVGPTPDQDYIAEITGTFRPAPMSPSNETSYIGNFYPDLLLAACTMFLFMWQRDFAPTGDNPEAPMSWETTYKERLKSALEEEQRKKFQSTGWSPFSTAPLSQPQRT